MYLHWAFSAMRGNHRWSIMRCTSCNALLRTAIARVNGLPATTPSLKPNIARRLKLAITLEANVSLQKNKPFFSLCQMASIEVQKSCKPCECLLVWGCLKRTLYQISNHYCVQMCPPAPAHKLCLPYPMGKIIWILVKRNAYTHKLPWEDIN